MKIEMVQCDACKRIMGLEEDVMNMCGEHDLCSQCASTSTHGCPLCREERHRLKNEFAKTTLRGSLDHDWDFAQNPRRCRACGVLEGTIAASESCSSNQKDFPSTDAVMAFEELSRKGLVIQRAALNRFSEIMARCILGHGRSMPKFREYGPYHPDELWPYLYEKMGQVKGLYDDREELPRIRYGVAVLACYSMYLHDSLWDLEKAE